jgi:hypothetical protein
MEYYFSSEANDRRFLRNLAMKEQIEADFWSVDNDDDDDFSIDLSDEELAEL